MKEQQSTTLADYLMYVEMHNYAGFPHHYAYIRFKDIHERLGYEMTGKDAAAHNKENRRRGAKDFAYRKDDWCEQFFSEHEVRELAAKVFQEGRLKNHYGDKTFDLKGAKFLIDGHRVYCQPQRIIACAPGLEEWMRKLNEIFLKGLAIDDWNWDVDNDTLSTLSKQWYALLDAALVSEVQHA